MSRNCCGILVYSILFFALPGVAAEREWTKASTPHFELYTNGGDGAARRTLLFFEKIRGFFLQAMQAEEKDAEPIRIVGFRGYKDFEPYRPNETASAFYLGGYDRDNIVIGNISAESHETAVHEYVHLLVRHSKLELPPWLNEGLAVLYSTLEPSGNKVKVGNIPVGRYQLLQRGKWIPVERILEVGRDSPEYNTKKHAGMFYSQAWALTHMLSLDPDFRPKYSELIKALAHGGNSAQAIRNVYGLSPDELEKELRGYIDGQRFFVSLFDVKLENVDLDPSIETAPELEVGLALGQLTASMRNKKELARKTYEELAAKYPDAPEAPEALGYMAWRAGDDEQGRVHFARASELGSKNAKMYYDLAYLSRRSSDPEAAIAALEKAVELKPDYDDARKQLGGLYLRDRMWARAVLHLNKITRVETSKEAYWLYHSRAFGYFQLEQMEEAERLAGLARQYAEEPRDVNAAESLMAAIEHRKAGDDIVVQSAPDDLERPLLSRREVATTSTGEGLTREFEYEPAPSFAGKLMHFDCLEQGARLHIESDGQTRIFAIVDPAAIVLVSAQGGEAQFTCGPQDGRAIRVEYGDELPEGFEAEAAVTLIEFPE